MLRAHDLWKYPPGKYFDSHRMGVPGLMLLVKAGERKPESRRHNKPTPGGRSWVLRVVVNGRRVELGIGSLREMPLSKAREIAMALRQEVRAGFDPRKTRAERRAKRVTFREVAERVWTERAKGLRNEKHAAQWATTLQSTFPVLGNMPIADVDSD